MHDLIFSTTLSTSHEFDFLSVRNNIFKAKVLAPRKPEVKEQKTPKAEKVKASKEPKSEKSKQKQKRKSEESKGNGPYFVNIEKPIKFVPLPKQQQSRYRL